MTSRTPAQLSPRPPAKPRRTGPLVPADPEGDDLVDDAHVRGRAFTDLRLADRAARLVDVEECEFTGVDLSGTTLSKATFADCTFDRSNLANLGTTESSLLRCRLRGLRTTGLRWVGGTIRDVVFERCKLDLSVFRFTSFARTHFVDCVLRQADFTNADLRGVRFVDCDLTAAQFSHADLHGARLENCVLDGLGGVTSLRGAIVDPNDLIALTHTLAGALGIVLETSPD